nr:MAG TPA: Thrombin light chain, Thrombin heavy non-proteolytic Activator, hydrolase-hydrolase inhibitor [Caudoviricetes sp.]
MGMFEDMDSIISDFFKSADETIAKIREKENDK